MRECERGFSLVPNYLSYWLVHAKRLLTTKLLTGSNNALLELSAHYKFFGLKHKKQNLTAYQVKPFISQFPIGAPPL